MSILLDPLNCFCPWSYRPRRVCVEHAIEVMVVALHLPFSCPSWCADRLWPLHLSHYKLTRPKTHAGDWVWIVDHTVQLGQEKCIVILGIRLGDLPSIEYGLRREDVEPIVLVPIKHSNGTVIYQQPEQAVTKIGISREILGDHGTDLEVGINYRIRRARRSILGSFLGIIAARERPFLKRL